MPAETITWHPVGEKLPDADLTVLIALNGEETVAGFLDGEYPGGRPLWRDTTAIELHGHDVTHWADMPRGPAC